MRTKLKYLLVTTSIVAALCAPATAADINLNVVVQGDAGPYEAIAEAFEKVHADIQVTIQTPAPTYEEVLQRTLRGALVGDAPDVAFQGYNLIRQVASSNAATDLTAFAASDAELTAKGYDPALSPLCSADGKLVGLPFAISLPILFFNADLVRKAGGDPDAFPKTWDGIVSLAERIHNLDPKTQGIHFRYVHSGNWSFQALITSAGGRMMSDDDKSVEFNGPQGVQALGLFKQFVDRGGMVDLTANQARQAFSAGTIGIMSESSAFLAGASKSAQGNFNLRTASYPLADGSGRVPPGGNCVTIATSEPDRQKAAWEFVKFAVGPAAQFTLATKTGYVPANRITMQDASLLGDLYKQPNYQVPLGLLSHLTQWYGFPPPNSAKISDAIQGQIQSVVSGSASPKDAMDAMVSEVTKLLP